MGRVKLIVDENAWSVIRDLVDILGFKHVDVERIRVVRSFNSRTTAYARIYGLPRVFQVAFGYKPSYVIEIVHSNFSKLDCKSKIRVLIHELLHIPKTFSGGLRPHGELFYSDNMSRLLGLVESHVSLSSLCRRLENYG